MAGSMCSSKSSTRQGLPILTAAVTCLRKFYVLNFSSVMSLSFSIFFSHLFACCCGSMHKAYLSAAVVRIPFSNETWSLGNPAIPQPLMTTGSPMMVTKVKSSLVGILLSRQPATHFDTSYSLNCPVNPPKYEIQAHDKKTLPTSLSMSPWIVSTVSFHLTPSSARSTTSFSALIILFDDLSISNSRASFSSYIAWHSASSFATSAFTAATLSNFTCSSPYACLRIAVTSACLAFLGATFLVTYWYLEQAVHQIQRAAAATDFYLTKLGSKSGFVI